jgi:hypothetical protein
LDKSIPALLAAAPVESAEAAVGAAVVGEADCDEDGDPHALAMATSVAAAPIVNTRVRLVVAGLRR